MSLKICQNTEDMILEKEKNMNWASTKLRTSSLQKTLLRVGKNNCQRNVNPNQNEIPLHTLWVGQNLKSQIKTSVDKNVEKS